MAASISILGTGASGPMLSRVPPVLAQHLVEPFARADWEFAGVVRIPAIRIKVFGLPMSVGRQISDVSLGALGLGTGFADGCG
jgi:hypothetical protein